MKSSAKRLLGLAARAPVLARGLLALTRPNRFLVLGYHRVNDDGHPFFCGTPTRMFRAQMELVRRYFSVQPLDALVAGDAPPNAIAITFDDGYRDNYTNAFPILRELGLPATIFLVTGAVDANQLIWHDRIFDAFHRTRVPIPDKHQELASVLGEVRGVGPEERSELISRLLERLGVDSSESDVGWDKLTWDDVREMAAAGIRFGAHTLDHPILSHVSPEEARRQVKGSKEKIESELGCEVTSFAYPNGRPVDFDATTKQILRKEGFLSAVTTVSGSNDASSDPFELRRVGFWHSEDPYVSFLRFLMVRARS